MDTAFAGTDDLMEYSNRQLPAIGLFIVFYDTTIKGLCKFFNSFNKIPSIDKVQSEKPL